MSKLAAIAALASSLALMTMADAGATPSVALKGLTGTDPGLVELVRQGGGGGRGGGGGGGVRAGGGGGHAALGRVGGGGGKVSLSHRGGSNFSGRLAARSYDGGVKSHSYKGHVSTRYAAKSWDGGKKGYGGKKGHGDKWAGNNWHGKKWNDKHHHHHHKFVRRFYGPDILVYGGGYGGYDCGWIRRQAIITGSPYWWQRYQACISYDYYY